MTAIDLAPEQRLPQQMLLLPTLWFGASSHHLRLGDTLSAKVDTDSTMIADLLTPLLEDDCCAGRCHNDNLFLQNALILPPVRVQLQTDILKACFWAGRRSDCLVKLAGSGRKGKLARKIGGSGPRQERLMHSVASRSVNAAFFLYGLAVYCCPQAIAYARPQQEELIRQMPGADDDSVRALSEQLPLPRELPSEAVIFDEPWLLHPPTRINRYDVWQFYEVGRYGQFRPRVIYSPYGSYYFYDGRPYPWISTHQLDFMLRVVGP